MSALFIGLMSGTSMDAIDAALVDLSGPLPQLVAARGHPISAETRQALASLGQPGGCDELARCGELDVQMGELFAEAAVALLKQTGFSSAQIRAIGSHGQTVRHQPNVRWPYTLQIGDPNVIAERTGITTVADFRRRDLAAGGQGAPLVPAFHAEVLRSTDEERAIVNIGGMANITVLPVAAGQTVYGFDTGPGNVLLDEWCLRSQGTARDENGAWAASGTVSVPLLRALLDDAYFQLAPPKSTGREDFNLAWLLQHLAAIPGMAANDVQATLAELTACSIAEAVHRHAPQTRRLLVCGGGIHNADLMSRLRARMQGCPVQSTAEYGIEPDWMEAMAFAWLACRTLQGKSGNLPAVTGARRPVILGAVYPAG